MKIRLLKPYLMSARGDIINPAAPIANELIRRGVAEYLIEEQQKTKSILTKRGKSCHKQE
jgi:hypothetical protein